MSDTILVEVVFADKDSQDLNQVTLPFGATVADAVEESGLQAKFPKHDFRELKVGIWGKVVARDYNVRAGDRIEIYRDLEVDPMEARRIRAMAPDPGPYESR